MQREDFQCVAGRLSRGLVMGLYMVIEPSGARETVAEYWEQLARNL